MSVIIVFVAKVTKYYPTLLRGWRNRQTRTFEGRVVNPCRFKSGPSHQKSTRFYKNLVDFTYYLFTIHFSLKRLVDFWEVIGNSE